MLNRLILQIIAGILGLWLAAQFIPGVTLEVFPGQSAFLGIEFTEKWQVFLLIGSALGLVNLFIKPILKVITLPLRILTFGIFGLVINMIVVWMVDVVFLELTIFGLLSLFWTTIIIWGISFVLGVYKA